MLLKLKDNLLILNMFHETSDLWKGRRKYVKIDEKVYQ